MKRIVKDSFGEEIQVRAAFIAGDSDMVSLEMSDHVRGAPICVVREFGLKRAKRLIVALRFAVEHLEASRAAYKLRIKNKPKKRRT